jgi:hypothetical protein
MVYAPFCLFYASPSSDFGKRLIAPLPFAKS